MKFSIRYVLFATALLAFAFAVFHSSEYLAAIFISVLAWPTLICFALAASTMESDKKVRAIFVSSVLTFVVSVPMLASATKSPFAILIAVFLILIIAASWVPQFLAIIQYYDAPKS